MAVTPRNDVPGLTGSQKAFELDSGDVVVVETTQVAPEAVGSHDFVAIKMRSWKVNPADGSVVMDTQDPPKPLEIPEKIESITMSSLAEGTVDLTTQLAQYSTEALARISRWLPVKALMANIAVSQ